MLLIIMLSTAAVIGVGIGVKGLIGSGVQLSRTKTIRGVAGKIIAVICLVFGLTSGFAALFILWAIVFVK